MSMDDKIWNNYESIFFTIIMSIADLTFFLKSLKNKYSPHHSYINNITLKEIKFLVCLKLSNVHNLNIL